MANNTSSFNIALIGCGRMGSALLRGWLSSKIGDRILILEPAGIPDEFKNRDMITCFTSTEDFAAADAKADIYVLAVKPQIMGDVCAALAPSVPDDALILSIVAGQTIGAFTAHFGNNQPIVRSMPNTPAAIGKGITVAVGNNAVTTTQKERAATLLQAAGVVEWLDDEALLDAVTAVSGSGPAYIFLLIETMAKAGERAGLAPDLAMKLARQTVIGAAALAENDSKTPAATLRENVTSPGGTTAAALDVLMNGELQDLFDRAIAAATARGKELSK